MSKLVNKRLMEHLDVMTIITQDEQFKSELCDIANLCVDHLRKGNRIFFAGNGGSCAQAQHLAAELSGRYLIDRKPLDVLNLSDNVSFITAVSNDYDYKAIYARALEAHARENDILFLLTTSGQSENILKAKSMADQLNVITIAFTGRRGINFAETCQYKLVIPASETALVQEMHIVCGHIICEIIEKKIFG